MGKKSRNRQSQSKTQKSRRNSAKPPENASHEPPDSGHGTRGKASSRAGAAKASGPGWIIPLGLTLTTAALGLSIYLLWTSLSGAATAGCGPESSCGGVLNSRWAYIGPVPVSLFALPVYLGIGLGFLFRANGLHRLQWIGNVCAMMAIGSAVYFAGIQYFVLKSFCVYCLTTHTLATVAGLLVWRRRVPTPVPGHPSNLYALAGIVWAAGIILQITWAPQDEESAGTTPPVGVQEEQAASQETPSPDGTETTQAAGTTQEPEDRTAPTDEVSGLTRLGNVHGLDVNSLPLLGNREARHVAIAMIDYTCKYCRNLHMELEKVVSMHPYDIAFLMVPMPLDSECNPALASRGFETSRSHVEACEFARLALAMNRTSPEAFRNWDREIMHRSRFPTFMEALTLARSMVDPRELAENIIDPWVQTQINASSKIYDNHYSVYGKGTMPQMIMNDKPQFTPFNGAVDVVNRLRAAFPGQFPVNR